MTVYRFVVVVFISLVCFEMGKAFLKFQVNIDTKLSENEVNITAVTGLSKCLLLCETERYFLCQTASWGAGICLLSDIRKMDEYLNTPGLEANSEWVTMFRAYFPVFIAEGLAGASSMTFEEGVTRCAELGSVIATSQDLLDARKLGFDVCVCGWLADGASGFVTQVPDSNCWSLYLWNDGIVDGCADGFTHMDVYCQV